MSAFKKILFHRQTFLLLLSLFFLWYAIDGLYGFSISESDLKTYRGKISTIDTSSNEKEIRKANSETETYITLFSEPGRKFKIKSSRLYKDVILPNLKVGDNIMISTVPRLYDNSRSSYILRISKDNNIIMDTYHIAQKVSLNLFMIFIALFLTCFVAYFLKARKCYHQFISAEIAD